MMNTTKTLLCVALASALSACGGGDGGTGTGGVTPDTTAPVITLVGDADLSLEAGVDYTEQGASASDNVDGSVSVTTSGEVDNTMLGDNILTYTATDSAGNSTSATRTITVVDTTAPAINLVGEASVSLDVGSTYAELGANAVDMLDGVVEVTVSGQVDNTVLGDNIITYTAIDAAQNTLSIDRTVTVVDMTAPALSLVGDVSVTLDIGATYIEQGASAVDILDGVVDVTISGEVDNTVLGDYTITYTAIDAAENTRTITRVVTMVDTSAPMLSLVGDAAITLEAGVAYTEQGATALDNLDGALDVAMSGAVDTTVLGQYIITCDGECRHFRRG